MSYLEDRKGRGRRFDWLGSGIDTSRPGFPGEKHMVLKLGTFKFGRANYMGPGTQLTKRLRRGDPPRSEADKVAQAHDVRYALAVEDPDPAGAVRKADKKMSRKLVEIASRKGDSWFNTTAGRVAMSAKMAAENIGLMNRTRYLSKSPLDPDEKALFAKKLEQLEQEGFGNNSSSLEYVATPGARLRDELTKGSGPGSKPLASPGLTKFVSTHAKSIVDGTIDPPVEMKGDIEMLQKAYKLTFGKGQSGQGVGSYMSGLWKKVGGKKILAMLGILAFAAGASEVKKRNRASRINIDEPEPQRNERIAPSPQSTKDVQAEWDAEWAAGKEERQKNHEASIRKYEKEVPLDTRIRNLERWRPGGLDYLSGRAGSMYRNAQKKLKELKEEQRRKNAAAPGGPAFGEGLVLPGEGLVLPGEGLVLPGEGKRKRGRRDMRANVTSFVLDVCRALRVGDTGSKAVLKATLPSVPPTSTPKQTAAKVSRKMAIAMARALLTQLDVSKPKLPRSNMALLTKHIRTQLGGVLSGGALQSASIHASMKSIVVKNSRVKKPKRP